MTKKKKCFITLTLGQNLQKQLPDFAGAVGVYWVWILDRHRQVQLERMKQPPGNNQGNLSKVKGSVHLTKNLIQFQYKKQLICTSWYKEVNRTVPSLSVRIPVNNVGIKIMWTRHPIEEKYPLPLPFYHFKVRHEKNLIPKR